MPARIRIALPAFIFAVLIFCLAAGADNNKNADDKINLDVKKYTLENGLRLLVLRQTASPTVAVDMHFLAGGADDPKGLSGMSHFLEHMLFKGTKTIGSLDPAKERRLLSKRDRLAEQIEKELARGEDINHDKLASLRLKFQRAKEEAVKYGYRDAIWKIYPRNGGVGINGSTSKFSTRYYCQLPKNRLELWARVESDRMVNAVFRQFFSEKGVIMEERRRGLSDPGRLTYEMVCKYFYGTHTASRPVVGFENEIKAITPDNMREYYNKYYCPSNVVLTVVGDVEPEKVFQLVKKYFGKIKRRNLPERNYGGLPEQKEEKRVTLTMPFSSRLQIAYRVPELTHKDGIALDALSDILSGSGTSRLYKKIVKDKHAATTIGAWKLPAPTDAYFQFYSEPQAPFTLADNEKMITDEIEDIKKNGVTEHELEQYKNASAAGFVRSLQSNKSLANILSFYETFFGSWDKMLEQEKALQELTTEDIRRVAQKYFDRNKRLVIYYQQEENKTQEQK